MNRRKSALEKKHFNYIQTPKAPVIPRRLSIETVEKLLNATRL